MLWKLLENWSREYLLPCYSTGTTAASSRQALSLIACYDQCNETLEPLYDSPLGFLIPERTHKLLDARRWRVSRTR